MSSSSVLLFFGLYQPISAGIATLDLSVLIPFAIGIIETLVLLVRIVSHLFEHHHGIAFYCVIGFVIASTIQIIPLSLNSAGEVGLCFSAVIVGFLEPFLMDRWSEKHPIAEADPVKRINETEREFRLTFCITRTIFTDLSSYTHYFVL